MAIQWNAQPTSGAIKWGGSPSQTASNSTTSSVATPTLPQNANTIWSTIAAYGNSVKTAAQGGAKQIQDAASTIENPPANTNSLVTGTEAALKGESGIASIVTSPLAPLFKPVQAVINAVGDKIGESKFLQEAVGPQSVPVVQKNGKVLQLTKDNNSFDNSAGGQVLNTAQDAGNVASTILGVGQAAKLASKIPEKVSNLIDKTKEAFSPSEATVAPIDESAIVDYYNKAIKPTVAGKKTPQLLDKYNSNIVSGIKSIVDNKDNLSFTNSDGNVETGRTPSSVIETAQAIDQTKSAIFNQYDALAKAAGEQGIKVSADPLLEQLNRVTNSEALQLTHPEAVSYANALKARLTDSTSDGSFGVPKQYDPQTVQEVIKNYNASLEAFYKNPSFDDASKAAINAGVVSTLRKSLSDAIENSTGENYSALKQQYGALSAIEADVAKRATVLARQQSVSGAGGLGDYAQIFSGGDMVHGLLSLNPSLFVKGAAQSLLTNLFAKLKSPDRAIQNMFNAANSSATK